VNSHDAPFGKTTADSMTLHYNGTASYIRGQAGQPVFDDMKSYFDPNLLDHGVKVRNAGVKIEVLSQSGTSVKIRISSKAPAPTS
jgi:immune inhibitor A